MITRTQAEWDRVLGALVAMLLSLIVMIAMRWMGVHDLLVGIFGGGLFVRVYDDFTRGT